jgi:hypothetical protein
VAYIKRVIKDKSRFPTLKLRALESLCTAMSTHHSVLAAAVVKKFLRRLALLAQYRKELRSESRGATLFAGHSLSSAEETSASVAFLTCLLIALRSWPDLRVEERDKEAFKGAYQALLRAGVAFPKEPMLVVGQKDNSVLERHKETGTALIRLINRENSDKTAAREAAESVAKSLTVLQAELQDRLNKGTAVQELIQTCEHLNECLVAYQCWLPALHRSSTVPERANIAHLHIKRDNQSWTRSIKEPKSIPAPIENIENSDDSEAEIEISIPIPQSMQANLIPAFV